MVPLILAGIAGAATFLLTGLFEKAPTNNQFPVQPLPLPAGLGSSPSPAPAVPAPRAAPPRPAAPPAIKRDADGFPLQATQPGRVQDNFTIEDNNDFNRPSPVVQDVFTRPDGGRRDVPGLDEEEEDSFFDSIFG